MLHDSHSYPSALVFLNYGRCKMQPDQHLDNGVEEVSSHHLQSYGHRSMCTAHRLRIRNFDLHPTHVSEIILDGFRVDLQRLTLVACLITAAEERGIRWGRLDIFHMAEVPLDHRGSVRTVELTLKTLLQQQQQHQQQSQPHGPARPPPAHPQKPPPMRAPTPAQPPPAAAAAASTTPQAPPAPTAVPAVPAAPAVSSMPPARPPLPQPERALPAGQLPRAYREVPDLVSSYTRVMGLASGILVAAQSLTGLLAEMLAGRNPRTVAAVAVAIALDPHAPLGQATAVANACGLSPTTVRSRLSALMRDAVAWPQIAACLGVSAQLPPSSFSATRRRAARQRPAYTAATAYSPSAARCKRPAAEMSGSCEADGVGCARARPLEGRWGLKRPRVETAPPVWVPVAQMGFHGQQPPASLLGLSRGWAASAVPPVAVPMAEKPPAPVASWGPFDDIFDVPYDMSLAELPL